MLANEKNTKEAVTELALSALKPLNREIAEENGGWVRGFHIEYDREVDGWCANLIWEVPVLPEPEIDETEELSAPDLLFDLCSLGSEKLTGIVSITNCEYVTAEEYESKYSSANWRSVLIELEDDSQH